QPIAAIAAVNWGIANAALQKVKIDYEVLPAVIDMDEALKPSSPPVYIDRNRNTKVPNAAEGLLLPGRWNHNERRLSPKLSSWRTGAAGRRIKTAQEAGGQNLVTLTYKNAQQAHTALEPHAAVAKWEGPTKVAVHASTQGIHFLRKEIAEHFDLNKEDVQLDAQHIGGGFGGKQGLYPEIIAAVSLARFAERPVRVACDRLEEISYTALRPGGTTTATVAVQDDGSPEAVALRAYGHAGNGIGALTAGLYGLISPSIPRDLTDSNVVTHTPPGKPFRGPDAPLTFWAMEQTIDEVAHRKQTSPVTIRRKWYPEHDIRNALYDWVEALPEWATRGPVGGDGGRFRRGIGLSSPSWSFIYNPDVKVTVRATAEGIVVETASQDIGNGTRTALAKAIEDPFGIHRHEGIVNIAD
ncbi:MAG: xanthine dehydrogenase family protein molybdopterin-binding subunit, partial [Anaerolineales bacterium]|nr:xanthine dehydrogenase family protein molybdopterin-binding subunit [Anaerolineales bacterium]